MEKDFEVEIISDLGMVYEPMDCYWASDLIDDFFACLNEEDPSALHAKDFDGWGKSQILDFICEQWGIALKRTGKTK